MIKLLEAVNRGILRGLNEQNIELLSDLDDENLDQMDSLQTKSVNNKINAAYRYFPKTAEELINIIKDEIKKKGWNCNLNHIDVSKITDMSSLFSSDYYGHGLNRFNGDISKWDVSSVKDMRRMFMHSKFKSDLSKWEINKNCDCRNILDMIDDFPEEYLPIVPKQYVEYIVHFKKEK